VRVAKVFVYKGPYLMNIQFILFDLDGTVIDTLTDLTRATNDTLKEFKLPLTDQEGVKASLGSGAVEFIKGILKPYSPNQTLFEQFFASYMVRYKNYQLTSSKPFPGIVDLLNQLKKQGIQSFIFSNKPDDLTHTLIQTVLPNHFVGVQGHVKGTKAKPDVTELTKFCHRYGIDVSQTIFVGDSPFDIETAKNLNVPSVGCTWGFVSKEELAQSKPDFLINHARELWNVIESLKRTT
jgi:phosphoglycolate phosphatase